MKKPNVFSRSYQSARQWVRSFSTSNAEIERAETHDLSTYSTTVSTLLTSGRKLARTRQAIYQKWSEMESDAIVSTAISLLVTSALGGHETTGDVVFIERAPDIEKNAKLEKMVDEISDDLSELFNRVAYKIAYSAAAFGDSYARIYSDERGVVDLYIDEMVRAQLVVPYERGGKTVGYVVHVGEKSRERLNAMQMARMKMPRTQWVPQHGIIEKSFIVSLAEENIDDLPVVPSMVGGSLIYNAEEAYDNLVSSIIGLVGQRCIDSIDEQILSVNVESMTREQQEVFLTSIKDMLLTSKQRVEEVAKSGKPLLERIRHIVPVFNEKQLLSVSNSGQDGRNGSITIDDVMFHAKLLAGALGVDISLLGFADQLSGGLGEGGFFRVSAQAAERARIIRGALSDFFCHIIDIHTMKRYGIVFPESHRPWRINYHGSISALDSEKQRTRMEAMNAGMMLAQGIQQMKDLGANSEIMFAYLSDVMKLDANTAKLFSQIAGSGETEEEVELV